MLGQKSNRIYAGNAPPLRAGHPVLLAVDGILAAYAAFRRWLECRDSRHALAELDEHRLRDIGVTRSEALRESRRWWQSRDNTDRALANLDDSELHNLSDFGRQVRRQARRAR